MTMHGPGCAVTAECKSVRLHRTFSAILMHKVLAAGGFDRQTDVRSIGHSVARSLGRSYRNGSAMPMANFLKSDH